MDSKDIQNLPKILQTKYYLKKGNIFNNKSQVKIKISTEFLKIAK